MNLDISFTTAVSIIIDNKIKQIPDNLEHEKDKVTTYVFLCPQIPNVSPFTLQRPNFVLSFQLYLVLREVHLITQTLQDNQNYPYKCH